MNTLTALRHSQALVEQEAERIKDLRADGNPEWMKDAVVLTFLDDANETNTKAGEVIAALIEELEATQ